MAYFISIQIECVDRHIEPISYPRNLEISPQYEVMTVAIQFKGSGNTTSLPTQDILAAIFKKLETVKL